MQLWNVPNDLPIEVLKDLKRQLKTEIGNTFHKYAENIGPNQVTVNFPADQLPVLNKKGEDVWAEVESGLFTKMPEDEIILLMDRLAGLVSMALLQNHFVEVFPRTLPMKLAGYRKPVQPA